MVADDCRHNGGIGNPEALDAPNADLVIDDGQGIGAHSASADRVIERLSLRADEIYQRLVSLQVDTGPDLIATIAVKRWRCG